jgi:hypothetical protein
MFEPTLLQRTIFFVNFFLKECLNGLVLSATWRFCYNVTLARKLSFRVSNGIPPALASSRLLVTFHSIPCSRLKSVACAEWFTSWDLETAITESGLPLPPEEEGISNLSATNSDRGGYNYSVLYETTVDDASGLDWMADCLFSFIAAARKLADPSKEALVRRLAVCLLSWIIQEDPSSHLGSCICSIKRSYTTLSLPTELKLKIYRGIVVSQLLPEYLMAHPWALSLRTYFHRYLGPISREILETCHETLLLHRLTSHGWSIPKDTSSDFKELSCVILLADSILVVMTCHIHLMRCEGWEPDKIFGAASSWFAPSWQWIFQDILILAKRVKVNEPQLYHESGLSSLATSVASFASQVHQCTLR